MSADFFDVEKYCRFSFSGIKVEKPRAEGSYVLHGDLTIKDITRMVKLIVEFAGVMKETWGNEKAGYTLTGKVNRQEWGLNWKSQIF